MHDMDRNLYFKKNFKDVQNNFDYWKALFPNKSLVLKKPHFVHYVY